MQVFILFLNNILPFTKIEDVGLTKDFKKYGNKNGH